MGNDIDLLAWASLHPEVLGKIFGGGEGNPNETEPMPTVITPHVEKKKVIKIKVDLSIYKKAMEYNMNIEEYLSTQLVKRVNQISYKLAQEKEQREYFEYEQERKILRIIRKMSKEASKTGYASQSIIVDEARLEGFTDRHVMSILDRLVEKKIIFQPVEYNYQIMKVKRKY